jgi:hypothetical protein
VERPGGILRGDLDAVAGDGGQTLEGIRELRGTARKPDSHPGRRRIPPPERARRSSCHDLPAGDDGHVVGEVLRFIHVVGGEQDGLAQFLEVPDDLPCAAAGSRIEAGGRLVQEKKLRVTGEGHTHVEAPHLPAGELAHSCVPLLLETHEFDDLIQRPGLRVCLSVQLDGLGHREVDIHSRGLKDDTHPLLQ